MVDMPKSQTNQNWWIHGLLKGISVKWNCYGSDLKNNIKIIPPWGLKKELPSKEQRHVIQLRYMDEHLTGAHKVKTVLFLVIRLMFLFIIDKPNCFLVYPQIRLLFTYFLCSWKCNRNSLGQGLNLDHRFPFQRR